MRAVFCALFLLLAPAWAHISDDAFLEIRIVDRSASVDWKVPRTVLDPADLDQDGEVSNQELAQFDLAGLLRERFTFRAGDRFAKPRLLSKTLERSPTHYQFTFLFELDQPAESGLIHYSLFPQADSVPRCLAVVHRGELSTSLLFTPDSTEAEVALARGHQPFRSFVALGVQHILEGYDHLLFLLCLLLPGGRFSTLCKVVTSFTVAHSVTLALAVFDIVSLPSWLVESVILLSIGVAALLNILHRDQEDYDHWKLAAVFGLIHGLGFASVLREMELTGMAAALPLVGFNVGVELGQLLLVVLAYPLLARMQEQTWRRSLVGGLSGVILVISCFWLGRFVYHTWRI